MVIVLEISSQKTKKFAANIYLIIINNNYAVCYMDEVTISCLIIVITSYFQVTAIYLFQCPIDTLALMYRDRNSHTELS